MARNYPGSAGQGTSRSEVFLANNSGPFTVLFLMQPDSLSQTSRYLWASGNSWALIFGYTGTSPIQVEWFQPSTARTGSQIDITTTSTPTRCGYRYTGAEWSKWKEGTKSIINASISFTTPAGSGTSYVGRSAAGDYYDGTLAEICMWSIDLTDQQMADWFDGVLAGQIAPNNLVLWLRLMGNRSPETDWASNGSKTWSVGTEVKATHPTLRAYDVVRTPKPVLCAELTDPATGRTIYAATRDLSSDWRAADTLGGQYDGLLVSKEVRLVEALSDDISGFDVPVNFTLEFANPAYNFRRAILADNPVGYWPLEETSGTAAANIAETATGNGTYTGGVSLAVPPGPFKGVALWAPSFDGSDDYITVPDNADLDVTGALTLGLIVCPFTSGSVQMLVAKTTAGSTPMPYRLNLSSTLTLQFTVGGTTVSSTTALAQGRPSLVHVTRDGTGLVRFWVNGQFAGSGTPTGTPTASTGALEFGRLAGGGGSFYLNGLLAHPFICNTALAQDRIKAHYRAFLDARARFDPRAEWRNVDVILRRFDLATYEAADLVRAKITDPKFPPNRAVFQCSNQDPELDSLQVPKTQVNVDDFPGTNDPGVPIPIPVGTGVWMNPSLAGKDESSQPGGYDFLIGRTKNASGAAMNVTVEEVWQDIDAASPGADSLTGWVAAPGSPAYSNSTHFTVSGDRSKDYNIETYGGVPIRYKTTATGGASGYFLYDRAIAYSGGTITLALGPIDAGLTSVEIATDFAVEEGRYDIGGEDLLSLRLYTGVKGPILARVGNTSLTNPSDVIKELVANAAWSAGKSVDSSSFSTARTGYAAVGFGSAIRGVIAGNRQLRALGALLREILWVGRARLYRTIAAGDYAIEVSDFTAPAAPTRTLGWGDGTWNNLRSCGGIERTPLENAVSKLVVHWGVPPKPRASNVPRDMTGLPTDYVYRGEMVLGTIGTERHLSLPWIRDVNTASEVLYYTGRRIQAADTQIPVEGGYEHRNIRRGELVNLIVPHLGIAEVWRVRKKETVSLDRYAFRLEPYIPETHTFDAAAIDVGTETQAETENYNESDTPWGFDGNPCHNPDFTIPPTKQYPASGTIPADYLPGHFSNDTATNITAWTTATGDATADACVGKGYMTVTTSTPRTSGAGSGIIILPVRSFTSGNVTFPCSPGKVVMFSIFCDRSDFFVQMQFGHGVTDDGSRNCPRWALNEYNQNGWRRYAFLARGQGSCTWASPRLQFESAATYKFDAALFEAGGKFVFRPSPWHSNPRSATDPYRFTNGEHIVRPVGEPENATYAAVALYDSGTLSGATVDIANAMQAGWMVKGISAVVKTAITGATSWSLGTAANPTLFATSKANAKGTSVMWGDHAAAWAATNILANTALRITANGSNFTGGAIKVSVHYDKAIPPTVA